MVGVAAAAPPEHVKGGGGSGKCNPRKTECPSEAEEPATTTTSTSTTTTVAPDTTPPAAHISSPTDGTIVDAGLQVVGSSSDDTSVAWVEVRVDGGSWQAATGTTSWQASVDTSAWAPGSSHTVGARAVDGAGNTSAVAGITLQKAAASPPSDDPVGDPSVAPATKGTWVSPEGATIEVTTTGSWTIRDIYTMLLENASAPGDFGEIAPTLTVRVQDQYASQTTTSTRSSGGVYTRFTATLYLKGSSSTFANQPHAQLSHEYGHVWTLYHLFMSRGGDWSPYLGYRWSTSSGTTLAEDSRLDSSYGWDRAEIAADDYRLLFGSAAAVQERPAHMNSSIPHPSQMPGLRDFFVSTWAG